MLPKTQPFMIVVLALGLSLFRVQPAAAYIPPSGFILKSLAAKHSGLAGIQVTSFVAGFENGKPGAQQFKAVSFYNGTTGNLISSAYDSKSGQKLYQVEKHAGSLSVPATLMLSSNLETLEHGLRSQGVIWDGPGHALVRFKAQVAWTLGETEAKLWVEKDSFLPIRLLTGGKLGEIRFENYRFYKEFPYPRLITLLNSAAVPLLQDEASEVLVFSDASKVAPKMLKLTAPVGFTAEGSAASSDLQELIKQYYEVLR